MTRGTGARLPWSWAEERLVAERNFWIATVTSQGMPHARPVWGVYLEGMIWLSIGAAGFTKADHRRDVSIHVDSATDVVIVDGTAERITDPAVAAPIRAVYNPKYEMDSDADFVNFVVRPRVAWGWSNGDVDTATKWTFSVDE